MHRTSFLQVLLLSAITHVLAVPVISIASKSKSATFTDTYDDLATSPPVGVTGNPVGIYHGLQYTGFIVGGPSAGSANDAHDGVIPYSHPNEAIALPQLTNMTGSSISVQYSGSAYKTFDLSSFYFGCTIYLAQGGASSAQGCVITVNGVYPNGTQTGAATYGFPAFNPEQAPMVKAILPHYFHGLVNATFGVASSTSTPMLTDILVDSLVHVNWT